MSRRLASLLVLAAAACDGRAPIPATEILLRVEAGAAQVAPGQAFPLTVLRVWSRELVPEEWRDEKLEPLAVRLVETRRREEGGRIEERRRYQAYAFALQDAVLAELTFRAFPRGGGPARVAKAGELRVRVVPALDPARPGAAELPGPPLERPSSWPAWAAAGAAAGALGLLVWSRRRRRRAGPAPGPPPPPPDARALARLGRLRGLPLREDGAFHSEVAAALRDYLAERFAACRPEMTTEELLASPRIATVLGPPRRELLAGFLSRCDWVKFAGEASTAAGRDRLLAGAEGFVRETRGG